jgi:Ca-activated chloride channel family protein
VSGFTGIDWSRPEWLAALVLVPLGIAGLIWFARRRRGALTEFAEPDVRERTQPIPTRFRRSRGALLIAGVGLLVLAIAGPRWGTEPFDAPPVGHQVVFALDVSRSMLAEDVAPSRLERSRRAIRQVMAGLPGVEAGLVVFAGEGALVVPLTRDVSALELYLGSVADDWISDPGTDLANAVAIALDAFGPGSGTGRAVVVFTDGEDHAGGLDAVGRAAREKGVPILTVGVGTEEGARIPIGPGAWLEAAGAIVQTRLEAEPLSELAEWSGGQFVTLDEGDEGVVAVTARLRGLEAAGEASEGRRRQADRYRWPLALALACFGIEVALRLGSRRRRPSPALTALAMFVVVAMGRSASPEELYEEGRYQEALEAWRHADRSQDAGPEDAYNRGVAAYRLGEYREAAASSAVAARTVGRRDRASGAWYNAGNGRYRIAQEVDTAGEEEAVRFWDSAVAAYREALLRESGDQDAKHNLELALRRRDEAAGGGGSSGGGGEDGGGGGSSGSGIQPESSARGQSPQSMSRAEAERLLDALAAREREALVRDPGDQQAGRTRRPGW